VHHCLGGLLWRNCSNYTNISAFFSAAVEESPQVIRGDLVRVLSPNVLPGPLGFVDTIDAHDVVAIELCCSVEGR
jgi:hypothetical protein